MYIHETGEYSAENNRDTHGFLLCLVALSPPPSHATSYSIHPPPPLPPSRSRPHASDVVVSFCTVLLHSFAPSRYSLSSPSSHTHAYDPLHDSLRARARPPALRMAGTTSSLAHRCAFVVLFNEYAFVPTTTTMMGATAVTTTMMTTQSSLEFTDLVTTARINISRLILR